MKTTASLLATLLLTALLPFTASADPVQPSKYLLGPVGRDVAAALQRGAQEHRPVWIIAWDDKFEMTPEGRKTKVTDYDLSNFYGNAETKKIITTGFIQVFTSVHNPAVAAWIDTADISHQPIAIIVDPSGNMAHRQVTACNAGDGLKDVQKIVATLSNVAQK